VRALSKLQEVALTEVSKAPTTGSQNAQFPGVTTGAVGHVGALGHGFGVSVSVVTPVANLMVSVGAGVGGLVGDPVGVLVGAVVGLKV